MPKTEGALVKLLPVLLVGLTTAIAICLVTIRHVRITNGFYTLATKDPDTVGLVVQIIASALGACQVYAITTLVNYAVRLRLQHGNSIDLKLLRFWTSITNASAQAIRSSLPAGLLFTFTLVFILLRIPAALWAGALTPISATTNITGGSIIVPTYPAEDLHFWEGSFRKDLNSVANMSLICTWRTIDAPTVSGYTTVANVVSNSPAVDRSSALIGGLATASRKAPRTHARVDNAGWNYKGRSYGVGATAGLVSYQNVKNTSAPIQGWEYQEYGYDTTVVCHKNQTSNYTIYQLEYYRESLQTDKYSATKTYEISGTLPNSLPGVVEDYTLSTKTGTEDAINVFGWSTLSNTGGNMIAVAGTGNHRSFDKTICNVTFTPSLFSISINATDGSIIVTKLNTTSPIDIEPTGNFRRTVFYNLEQMSRMSSLTIASSLGQQLTLNYNAVRRNGSDNATLATEIVQDSIISLLEDLFVAHGQSQLVIANHSTPTAIQVSSKAVRIGSAKFFWAVLGWNLVVFAFILVESVRTRFWRDMSVFDFSDVPDVAVAASMGGVSVARACQMKGKGEERDEMLDLVRVRLKREKEGFALVGAEDWDGDAGEFEMCAGRDSRKGRGKEGQSLVGHAAQQDV